MFLVYTLVLLLLVVVRFVVARRVAALEKKYVRIARATDELLKVQATRPGNNTKPDPYAAARAAYLLGQAVERRERQEARYCAWQKFAERLNGIIAGLRSSKGSKLPYVIGALDVLLVLGVVDYLGYGDQISARALVQLFRSFVA